MQKFIILTLLMAVLTACTPQNTPPATPVIPQQTEPTPSPTPTPHLKTADKYLEISNQSSSWGLKKNKGAEPDIPNSEKELLRAYNGYYMDQSKKKILYLTFDEGYENGYTEQILDTLKKCQVPAAFFVTGPYLKTEQKIVKRMIAEGHIVGNHTVHHPNLPKLNDPLEMAKELTELNDAFENEYGGTMRYMRPPEGVYSPRLLAVAKDLGYKTILWSFAYKDWDAAHPKGADYAFSQVTPYLHDGAILLLHAVSKDNADALERIIQYAQESGYEFKSLDELE